MTALATTLRDRRVLLAAFALAMVLLAIATPTGALMLSPAIALVVALSIGLFPDERLILVIRRRLRRARAHAIVTRFGRPTPRTRAPRVGRTVAFALAMRPPPVAAAPSI